MSSISGFGLSGPVNLLLAFVVILIFIGVIAWVIRRIARGRRGSAARTRQPRLAVLDTIMVDTRRQLVIIRRDNIEHLLMIGGGSDLVIETNIVRASTANAGRDNAGRTIGALDASRTNSVYEGTSWPAPQPETSVRLQRTYPIEEPTQWPASVQPEPMARTDASPLRATPADRPAASPTGFDAAGTSAARQELPPTATVQPGAPSTNAAARLAGRLDAPQRQARPESQPMTPRAENAPLAAEREGAEIPTSPDSGPKGAAGPRFSFPNLKFERSGPSRAAPSQVRSDRPAPRPGQGTTPPERASARPKSKTLYESLEQEMASLLGKPPEKR
jgi:flagellar protein FliO/FliZ